MSKDIRDIEARIKDGKETREDTLRLLELVKLYKKRTHDIACEKHVEIGRLHRKIADFNFTLNLALNAIDPAKRGLHFSQVDLFSCVLDPSRIDDTRKRIAEEYLKSLEWRASMEERERQERVRALAEKSK